MCVIVYLYETWVCVCVCQIFGSRVRVDSTAKVAEIEMAEKEKMKEKVERILKHGINCFINRYTHLLHTHTPAAYAHTHTRLLLIYSHRNMQIFTDSTPSLLHME